MRPEFKANRNAPEDYADPVIELVRTAVACQPLDAVARLVDLLERSPHGRCAADEALCTAATELPVHEVAQLVHLLSQPPRSSDGADAILRRAAERRPVAEVSHLVTLLHQPPHAARAGSQTTRTAAGRRSVEELAELITSLVAERTKESAPESAGDFEDGVSPPENGDEAGAYEHAESGCSPAARWLPRLGGLGLLLCGGAHVPTGLHRGASIPADIAAIGLPALCVLMAVLLFFRSTIGPLAAGFLVSVAAMAPHVLAGIPFAPSPLSHTLHHTFLRPLPAFVAAGLAACLVLATLVHALAAARQPQAATAVLPAA
ncbi:hypothetical protein [Streptomyces rimosus]|uniref:hypothetical protein n=1 Tax=Streptomyces rimosus TaxID=1927 RepID=UPI00067D4DA5|nr:hypothetical protein [Streptomyces rimosus]